MKQEDRGTMGCLYERMVSSETGTNFTNWSLDMETMTTFTLRNRDGSAGKENRLRTARSKIQDLILGRDKGYCLFSKISRPSLGPTEHPIQWAQGLEIKDT